MQGGGLGTLHTFTNCNKPISADLEIRVGHAKPRCSVSGSPLDRDLVAARLVGWNSAAGLRPMGFRECRHEAAPRPNQPIGAIAGGKDSGGLIVQKDTSRMT